MLQDKAGSANVAAKLDLLMDGYRLGYSQEKYSNLLYKA